MYVRWCRQERHHLTVLAEDFEMTNTALLDLIPFLAGSMDHLAADTAPGSFASSRTELPQPDSGGELSRPNTRIRRLRDHEITEYVTSAK